MAARNDQGNLQPTLNKGAGGASLAFFFLTYCFKKLKIIEKGFLKINKFFLKKIGLSLRWNDIGMFSS